MSTLKPGERVERGNVVFEKRLNGQEVVTVREQAPPVAPDVSFLKRGPVEWTPERIDAVIAAGLYPVYRGEIREYQARNHVVRITGPR